ncbi:uncharacterized protein FOMMEDRAFT_28676 [Fomitiporia mediterranea MF3/22]|uniref:uncharacterized protein n=1 Tax=Fomitiporia mediterranea (strain MF3/22) TaxID=694068 RepID=UPI00044073A7|nr:uncharacterized protein FOMMEDRAFT_28676 [Fomitiporia mediterranea MF3/22]EJD03089.1 hypothetical protein FOMMEDRAFT_28676 [Fomitiporia mediterranea MF3/22]
MASIRHPVTTTNRFGQRAQPRPALSPAFVNAHPELCLAPRVVTVPLPLESQKDCQYPTRTSYPTADMLLPVVLDGGNGGTSYTQSGVGGHVTTVTPPSPDLIAGHHTPTNTVSLFQAVLVPIPKPHQSAPPPTPTASPPRPAVSSQHKRSSADHAPRRTFPTA